MKYPCPSQQKAVPVQMIIAYHAINPLDKVFLAGPVSNKKHPIGYWVGLVSPLLLKFVGHSEAFLSTFDSSDDHS